MGGQRPLRIAGCAPVATEALVQQPEAHALAPLVEPGDRGLCECCRPERPSRRERRLGGSALERGQALGRGRAAREVDGRADRVGELEDVVEQLERVLRGVDVLGTRGRLERRRASTPDVVRREPAARGGRRRVGQGRRDRRQVPAPLEREQVGRDGAADEVVAERERGRALGSGVGDDPAVLQRLGDAGCEGWLEVGSPKIPPFVR